MAIRITQIDESTLRINGKIVYKDANGKWIANTELTPSEKRDFLNHLEAIGEELV